jgi:hypothetical protein
MEADSVAYWGLKPESSKKEYGKIRFINKEAVTIKIQGSV